MSWLEIAVLLRDQSKAVGDPCLSSIYRVQMRGAALQYRWEAGK